jgi:DHA1 family bicyclomycin/chloramphenicol resistance-like MFS transporter
MIAGALSSGLVAVLFDGRSALSMAAVMFASSLLALTAYWRLARPAQRRIAFEGGIGAHSDRQAAGSPNR